MSEIIRFYGQNPLIMIKVSESGSPQGFRNGALPRISGWSNESSCRTVLPDSEYFNESGAFFPFKDKRSEKNDRSRITEFKLPASKRQSYSFVMNSPDKI
ncbi:MAG: hypothetical protein AB9891_01940 [Anaerolineaceae bacterium]